MRVFWRATGVCATIFLSACGGGGGGSSPSALPQSPGATSGVSNAPAPQPSPSSPTLAACNYVIFVPNIGNNTITEYDENGNQIALKHGAFPGVNQPAGITFDPVNQHLYVANQAGGGVSAGSTPGITEYDESGNPITAPGGFASSFDPTGITFDSLNSYIFTASVIGGQVQVFTQDGNNAPIPSGAYSAFSDGVAEPAFDAANGHVYVTDNNTGSPTNPFAILEFDKNGKLLTTMPQRKFPNINFPNGITYDSVNQHLYVANFGNNTVTEYDGDGNQIATSGTFPNVYRPNGITFDPSNQHLYVANSNNTITVYDQNGNQIKTSGKFPNLNNPGYLNVAPATQ